MQNIWLSCKIGNLAGILQNLDPFFIDVPGTFFLSCFTIKSKISFLNDEEEKKCSLSIYLRLNILFEIQNAKKKLPGLYAHYYTYILACSDTRTHPAKNEKKKKMLVTVYFPMSFLAHGKHWALFIIKTSHKLSAKNMVLIFCKLLS